MESQEIIYQRVAEKCQEYAPCRNCSLVSSAVNEEDCASCLKCDHFENEHCVLDLYDKIVNRI